MPWTTEYAAKAAGSSCPTRAQHAQYRPARMFRMSTQSTRGMWAAAGATTSILLTQTGVLTPVSLFVLLIALLVLLVVVLSGLLSLSCLTGLISSLVGLLQGLAPGTKTGD